MTKITEKRAIRNFFLYIIGIIFLLRAKIIYFIKGHMAPKPFDITESDRCIDYDFQVVENWMSHLLKYTNNDYSLKGKKVLELSPGTDLGTGIYLLSKGCSHYNAIDVFNHMKNTPITFYDLLFKKLYDTISHEDILILKHQLEETMAGRLSTLNYVVRNDFNILLACENSDIDLVISQAAFQCFDDVKETISQLNSVCKPGAILISEIDLRTLSRWIRDKDPNNIYRYSPNIYKLLWFRGIANRIRPFQYREALERNGWTDVSIIPTSRIENDMTKTYSGLYKTFLRAENQMDYLSIMLCARKGPAR